MESEAFHKFAQVASTTKAEVVQFEDCNLTREKLNAFAQGATDFGLKINRLSLVDKTMESEAFHEFAQVASTSEASTVRIHNSSLSSAKMNAFAGGATELGLKIQQLILSEENFKPSHTIIKNLCQLFSTVEESIYLNGWEIDQQGIDALQSDLIMLNKKLKIRINDVYLQVSTDQHSYSRIQSIKNSIRRIFRRERR
uniref:uncharacterized protein LOC120336618 n=1 Tax=Styela clava TaxID=7725 RepID=UPI00193A6B94|nr:uncharacterized protein LOC120336618 [Styela clava]